MLEDLLRSLRATYYDAPDLIRLPIGRAYASLPASLRLGKAFVSFSRLLRESRHWTHQQVLDYQYEELKRTLTIAHTNIPFYRKLYSEHGLKLSCFKAPEDIKKYPYLTKQDVKESFSNMINERVPAWKRLVTTTGGSTAEPMRFLQLKGVTRSKERAFIYAGWSRIGYRPGSRLIQLRGRSVGRPELGKHWEIEPIQNMLEMDSNYLTPERMTAYLKAIEAFQPEFMTGFPSSIYLLAKFIRDEGLNPPRLRGIMLGSENVYPWQRAMLKNVFQCPIVSHYGHSEMVILAMQASAEHDELLIFPEYGYTELIDRAGKNVLGSDKLGELVGTSFNNPVMPFIRYRTRDYAAGTNRRIDGSNYPVLADVEGRLQEFIVTRDRRLISVCTMGAAHFDVLDNVQKTQYYQDQEGVLEFRIVPRKGFTEEDRKRIGEAIRDKTQGSLQVKVVEVDEIAMPPSGKHLMLIQKLPLDVLAGSQDHLIPER